MSAIAATISSPFHIARVAAPHFAGQVCSIVCPRMRTLGSMDIHTLGHMLAETIIAAHRDMPDSTTIVLDVEEAIVPLYLDFAIQDLMDREARVGVIVLCGGATSHDDDSPLPKALCANVSAANRAGSLWHPILSRQVPARLSIADWR